MVASDPYPDRLQALQRLKVILLKKDGDFIVPISKPSVANEDIGELDCLPISVNDHEEAIEFPSLSYDVPEHITEVVIEHSDNDEE